MLLTACRRGIMIAQDAQAAIAQLARLPIHIDPRAPDPALIPSLALRHDLSSHDVAYLELALRLQLPSPRATPNWPMPPAWPA